MMALQHYKGLTAGLRLRRALLSAFSQHHTHLSSRTEASLCAFQNRVTIARTPGDATDTLHCRIITNRYLQYWGTTYNNNLFLWHTLCSGISKYTYH